MICFDLNKRELPDLAIKEIPTCPIWLFHEIFDYFWPKRVKNIRFLNEFKVYNLISFQVHLQQVQHGLHYLSSESFDEDHQSTTSSTESGSNVNSAHRKDHEFIPTRMKTISASKPAADPKQFTRIPSNPLLISAQKQLMQVWFDVCVWPRKILSKVCSRVSK